MKMHNCFTCEYRELPIAKHPCTKGIVDEKGINLNCMGYKERKYADIRGEKK